MPESSFMGEFDIAVVGAGPAGAVAARTAAQHGASVLLVEEHTQIGRPIQCTGLLSVRGFEESGASPSVIVREIRGAFVHGPDGRCIAIGGKEIKAFVIDRDRFDQDLVKKAEEAGVCVKRGARAVELKQEPDRKSTLTLKQDGCEQNIRAAVIIGADGPHSRIAQLAHLPRPQKMLLGVQAVIPYETKRADFVEVFVGRRIAPHFFEWAVLATNGGTVEQYEGMDKFAQDPAPLYAVPTTVGTGSEVTFFAVVTHPGRRFKMTVGSPRLAPRVAFLDPRLLATLPPRVVAHTGMDALTHAIEGYTSRLASPLSDALNLHAIRLMGRYLRRAFARSENEEAMAQMQYAACLTGIGFSQSRLGIVHAMAHPLGVYYHLPHGLSNALLLPHVMAFNWLGCPERFRDIAEALGVDVEGEAEPQAALAAVEAVRELEIDLGLPLRLRDAGITNAHFAAVVEDTMRSRNIECNPRRVTPEDIRGILERAL